MSEEMKKIDSTCERVGAKKARVCLPVTVQPYAEAEAPVLTPIGDPVIRRGHCCHGEVDKPCHFTITQTVQIDIPVEYGAYMSVGDTYVDYDGPYGGCADSEDEEAELDEEIEVIKEDVEDFAETEHTSIKDDFKSLFKGNK